MKTTNITDEKFKMEHFKMAHLNSQDLAILLRSRGVKIKKQDYQQLYMRLMF